MDISLIFRPNCTVVVAVLRPEAGAVIDRIGLHGSEHPGMARTVLLNFVRKWYFVVHIIQVR